MNRHKVSPCRHVDVGTKHIASRMHTTRKSINRVLIKRRNTRTSRCSCHHLQHLVYTIPTCLSPHHRHYLHLRWELLPYCQTFTKANVRYKRHRPRQQQDQLPLTNVLRLVVVVERALPTSLSLVRIHPNHLLVLSSIFTAMRTLAMIAA